MTPSPEELLGEAPLGAAVAALAERNRHHFEGMSDAERGQAVAHWRELAVSVLTAAAAAVGPAPAGEEDERGMHPGRAVVVFEDVGPDNQIAVHASFFPQLEDLGNGEVGGTPAQATAIELLQSMAEDAEGEEPPG